MVARFCRDRRHRRIRHIPAMALEAEGDADHTNDASVANANRSSRQYRPDHRGQVQAITELGARPDPPWRGAWLQRTNLWRNRTKPRTASERLRGVANDRAGSSIDRAFNFKEIEGLAATNKCLALGNKSWVEPNATNKKCGHQQAKVITMKSLLKSLATATMLIAPQVASAVELTCSAPIVYVGQQSRDAHDTVVGVDVYYSNGEWQVRHRMGNGSEVNRVNQYAMRDTSNRNMTQWRGESYKYPGILWMVGEIQRDKRTGQQVYVEWIYNRGRLTMNTAANCNEQVLARRPEPQYVPQPAPQPAPPPAPPTVTFPTVIVVPPAVVQNPAPVPPPPAVQNPAPAQPPAAQNPTPQPPAAKPPRRNSVPITVYNERAVLIDMGLGRQVVNMMLDTGASTSAITDEVANALVRDGQARWLGTRKFKMADGSMTEALALVINEVRIGSHVVRDVEASVVPNGTMMLRGV